MTTYVYLLHHLYYPFKPPTCTNLLSSASALYQFFSILSFLNSNFDEEGDLSVHVPTFVVLIKDGPIEA